MIRSLTLAAVFLLLFTGAGTAASRHCPGSPVSSGFALDSLDARNPQVLDNLETLCRVWGYAKYHHPAFCDTVCIVDADRELFALLPRIARADKAARNGALLEWVRGLGNFTTDRAGYEEVLAPYACRTEADLAWTADTARLGSALCALLQDLRYAERGANRYIGCPSGLNAVMANETADGSLDDCGVRLLWLFRFWNVVEYYNPNRNASDRDWGEVLRVHLPAFIPPFSRGYPEICGLVRELCDSHAASTQYAMFGMRTIPVEVRNACGRVFVTAGEALEKGDEILAVDGRDRARTHRSLELYEAVSNDENLDYMTARSMCSSFRDTAEVTVLRRGAELTLRVPTSDSASEWSPYAPPRMRDEANVRLIADSVGYVTGMNLAAIPAAEIMERFRATKAIVVDMRCYPDGSMFIYDFVGRCLLPRTTHYVTWLVPSLALPGTYIEQPTDLFVDWEHLEKGENPDYYKGRVIVLVDSSTQSMAEHAVMAFQAVPGCTVVGTQTAGADGNVTQLVMPGGQAMWWFSALGVYYPDGGDAQRAGVRIDIPVHPTVGGLQAGRDEILERALALARHE